jgi:type IV pilus assembly protein PilN
VIRINLLPHREMRRERRKKDFIGLAVLVATIAAGLAFLVGVGINRQIASQASRNTFIKAENDKLDGQIKEIATLRSEIDALKARQGAVENLQSDRTTPVHLLDELVKNTPEGIFLKTLKQEEKKVTIAGIAQSNERVSELLRNLAGGSPWFERPELIEIRSTALGPANAKDAKIVYEFSLTSLLKSHSSATGPKGEVLSKQGSDGAVATNLRDAAGQKISQAAAQADSKRKEP